MERYTGRVDWFSAPKGFGFIKPDETGASDVFCHFTQIMMEGYKTLEPGIKVSYEVGENHKGPMAVNILVEEDAEEG